jgi:Protein of unknown function (DUF3788)
VRNSLRKNFFNDKSARPDAKSVLKTLGTSGKYWQEIREYAEKRFGPLTEEWKYYSPKFGWTMKLMSKKRNLLFFTAMEGRFRLAFVFGNKAVEAIERSDLPKKMKDEVKNATKYVEGRGLRLEVNDDKTVANVGKLLEIKVEN